MSANATDPRPATQSPQTPSSGVASPTLIWNAAPTPVLAYDGSIIIIRDKDLLSDTQIEPSDWVHVGTLAGPNDELEVTFRVTGVRNGYVRCHLHDMNDETKYRVNALLKEYLSEEIDTPNTQAALTSKKRSAEVSTRRTGSARKKAGAKPIIAVGGIAAIAGASFLLANKPPAPPEPVAITNNVVINQQYVVDSPQSGTIAKILVASGDHVRAGQVIALITETVAEPATEDFNAQLQIAERDLGTYEKQLEEYKQLIKTAKKNHDSTVKVAESTLAAAITEEKKLEAKLKRIKPLVAKNLIPAAEAAEAKADLAAASTNKQLAQAKLDQLTTLRNGLDLGALLIEEKTANHQIHLETLINSTKSRIQILKDTVGRRDKLAEKTHTVRAPFELIVANINCEPNAKVEAGEPLATFLFREEQTIAGHIAPADASTIDLGMAVKVHVESLRFRGTGRIIAINNFGDPTDPVEVSVVVPALREGIPDDTNIEMSFQPSA